MALQALRLAVGTLTVIPPGPVGTPDRGTAGRAMLLAPLAAAPLGLSAGLVAWLAGRTALPDAAVGLLAVAVLALGSRAMHLDGLADTVDGLGSGWDAERALSVMRRGDLGPMGAVALIVVIGLQSVAIGALVHAPREAGLLALAVCGSRAALVLACRQGVPSARPGGLGSTVAGSVSPRAAAAVGGVALLVIGGADWLAGDGARGAIAVLVAAAAVAVLVAHCVRRLGGVTGDVMGAAVEVAFTALVLVLAT